MKDTDYSDTEYRERSLIRVKQDGLSLAYMYNDLKNDKEFVLEAVKQNGMAQALASDALQKDPDIIKVALIQLDMLPATYVYGATTMIIEPTSPGNTIVKTFTPCQCQASGASKEELPKEDLPKEVVHKEVLYTAEIKAYEVIKYTVIGGLILGVVLISLDYVISLL